jgi:hypothetical protein
LLNNQDNAINEVSDSFKEIVESNMDINDAFDDIFFSKILAPGVNSAWKCDIDDVIEALKI